MGSWPDYYNQIPPLYSAEDVRTEELIEDMQWLAQIFRERFSARGQLRPTDEDDRQFFANWSSDVFKRFIEKTGQPLVFKVGRVPIKAREIRRMNINDGNLALYDEIDLPPGFSFGITEVYHIKDELETYLVNPTPELASSADKEAQTYTGIAVGLQQIALNWLPESGGEITISEAEADLQGPAD